MYFRGRISSTTLSPGGRPTAGDQEDRSGGDQDDRSGGDQVDRSGGSLRRCQPTPEGKSGPRVLREGSISFQTLKMSLILRNKKKPNNIYLFSEVKFRRAEGFILGIHVMNYVEIFFIIYIYPSLVWTPNVNLVCCQGFNYIQSSLRVLIAVMALFCADCLLPDTHFNAFCPKRTKREKFGKILVNSCYNLYVGQRLKIG